jgi:uncharacterized protein (TIGR02300 family)
VARPELGVKRQCMSCGAKFYDLNKDPIICPKCAAVFQATGPTRVAPPAVARQRQQEEETEVEPAGPEMVSLDEVEASETSKDAVIEDDIEVADDVGGEEDTFLEEEEEGTDDVSGLIDGDIEEDDEP